jgi:hypothetical protein
MWNVEQRFTGKQIESLAALGFAVGSTRGVVRVEKYGSGAEFRKGTDDLYQLTVPPFHSPLGCGLSEIFADRRWIEATCTCIASRKSAQV